MEDSWSDVEFSRHLDATIHAKIVMFEGTGATGFETEEMSGDDVEDEADVKISR